MPARENGGTSASAITSVLSTRPAACSRATRSVRVIGDMRSAISALARSIGIVSVNGRIFVPVMRPYFPICWARCPSSGRMSLLIASRTAFSEPGIRKITVLPAVPAVARLSIAAGPISS